MASNPTELRRLVAELNAQVNAAYGLYLIFGDLRLLRHEILHNKSRLMPETAQKLEVVPAPTTDSVDLDKKGVEHLVRHVKAALDSIVKNATGHDPGYRTIWRVPPADENV